MSDNLTDYQVVTQRLKRVLKAQGLTYKKLALEIGLSESGVKKIFQAKDGAFQRLIQICKYLGVSLSEALEDNKTVHVSFTDQQQKEFKKDALLFKIYWMLVYERMDKSFIQKSLSLSDSKMFSYLRKLDTQGLIELLPQNRLKIPDIKSVAWVKEGEFVKKLYKDWSRNLLESVNQDQPSEEGLFMVRYIPMTKKTYQEFQLALKGLEDEFGIRSIREMKTRGRETHHVRMLVAVDNKSFVTG